MRQPGPRDWLVLLDDPPRSQGLSKVGAAGHAAVLTGLWGAPAACLPLLDLG
jgi:hypothetical protein